jgi:hypothetical protein
LLEQKKRFEIETEGYEREAARKKAEIERIRKDRLQAEKENEEQLTEKQKIEEKEWQKRITDQFSRTLYKEDDKVTENDWIKQQTRIRQETRFSAPSIPSNKSDFAENKNHLKNFSDIFLAFAKVPGITQEIIDASMNTIAQEGILNADSEGSAIMGIMQKTVDDHYKVMNVPEGTAAKDLNLDQRVAGFIAELNARYDRISGISTINQITDKTGQKVVTDLLIRVGKSGGAKIVQDAINLVVPGIFDIPENAFRAFKPKTLREFNKMMENPELRSKLLRNIADLRAIKYPDEGWRNYQFLD